jgi:AcrR family transcriptional regulator
MVYRKTEATEGRKEARRRLFLDTAIKLFGKHGYLATTVPMIVTEAKGSTGSFYMYFRNKEDVFNAALEELGCEIVKVLTVIREAQDDPVKRIVQGLEALFLYLAKNPEQARILIVESSGLSPESLQASRAILRKQADEVRQFLESAPARFDVGNATIAARCVVGATYEALYCWLEEDPSSRMPAADVARAVARFNTQAIRKASD